MARRSLYDTAQWARKMAIYALIGVLLITIIDTTLRALDPSRGPFSTGFNFYLERNPQDTLAIPQLPLNSLQIANNDPVFLVEGVFPRAPRTAFIYTVERPKVKLDYESKAVATATALGFNGANYTSLNGNRNTDLLWENATKTRSLKYNAETLTWQMRTQYFFDSIALQPKTLLPNIESYSNAALGLAQRLGLATGFGMENSQVVAVYAKLGNNALFTTPLSASGADYVITDVYRRIPFARLKPQNQYPEGIPQDFQLPPQYDANVYKQDPRQGTVRLIVSDAATITTKDVYEMDLVDYEYRTNALVRDVITTEEAWTKVRQGQGKLRLLKTDTSDYFEDSELLGVKRFYVDASKTEFGYYEPTTWDGFVYPIYVFRGRAELTNGLSGKFVFYMDAINRDVLNFN